MIKLTAAPSTATLPLTSITRLPLPVTTESETNGANDPGAPIRPWSSLLIRDYRLIFIAILCTNTSMHMRNVASLYQVYQLSGSSVQLGLAGFFQAVPY